MEISQFLQPCGSLTMMVSLFHSWRVVLARSTKKRNKKSVTEVLVQWKETNPKNVVWCELCEMKHKLFDFQ